MKKIILVGVILITLFLIGCTTLKTNDGTTITKTSSGDTQGETTSGGTTTKVISKTGDINNWCQTGAEWTTTSTGQTDTVAKMVIKGLVTTGKYQGLCQVKYDSSSAGNQANIEYYFSKDGKSGYMLIDVNGQKMEQTWTG